MPFTWFNRYCKLLERRDPVTSSSSSFPSFLSLGHRTNSWTQGLFKQCCQLSDWRQMTSCLSLFLCVCFFVVVLATQVFKNICIVIHLAQLVRNLPANAGDAQDSGSIPGLGGPPEKGNGNLLQYYCLKNSMDRGAWRVTVHGVAKSWTWLSTHTHTHTLVHWCENTYTLMWELGLSFWLFCSWLC